MKNKEIMELKEEFEKELKKLDTNDAVTYISLLITTFILSIMFFADGISWYWGCLPLSVFLQWIIFFRKRRKK